MINYKEAYFTLSAAVADVIEALKAVQLRCENLIVESEEENED